MSNKFYDDDFIFYDDYDDDSDLLVDISGGTAESGVQAGDKPSKSKKASHRSGKKDKDKSEKQEKKGGLDQKKKIIIACCIVGAVLVGAAVAGVCLLLPNNSGSNGIFEFKYGEGTTVSGVSIGGMTYGEALELLNSKEKSFVSPVSITVKARQKTYTLTQDDFEYDFDTADILTKIKNEEESSSAASTVSGYTITATCKRESIEAQAGKIKKDADVEPINARVSEFTPYGGDKRFKYAEAEVGYSLDGGKLESDLSGVFEGGLSTAHIDAVVKEVEAEISMDMVKKNIVELASYHTVSSNTANGTSNMGVALSACNGSVIEPGEVWSFNGCTGDSNLESNGYKSAGVISNGELVQGIGGGICQASSTIYNAAIRANLEIEERYPHLWASVYVPTGLDATIDYPNLDLKLSNPTDYQMFLECELDGSTLNVTFWGYKDSSYDEIKTENEIGSVSNGEFTARAWRVYYKDGKEINREELPSSTYESKGGTGGGSASDDRNLSGSSSSSASSSSNSASSKPSSNNSSSSKPSSNNSSSSKPSSSGGNSSSGGSSQTPTQAPTQEPKPTNPPETQAPTEPETEPPVENTDGAEENSQS